jgi:hypothetical protein
MTIEWVHSRGFCASLRLDGRQLACVLMREPECYMAAFEGEKPSTHYTENKAKAWVIDQLKLRLEEMDVFGESPVQP